MTDKIQIWLVLKEGKKKKALLVQTTRAKGEAWEPLTAPISQGEDVEAAVLLWTSKKTGMIFKTPPKSLDLNAFYYELSEKPPELLIDAREYQSFSWLLLKEVDECLRDESYIASFGKLMTQVGKFK